MNRVVLITGGSRGIGRATALKFGELGDKVYITYNINASKAQEVVETISNGGGTAYSRQLDLHDVDRAVALVDDILKTEGRIDVFVSNAAVVYDRPLDKMSIQETESVWRVNLTAPLYMSRRCAESMQNNKYGKIVLVTSTNGSKVFSPESIEYDMSKLALSAMTRDLAKNYAPVVNVNAVAPGWVDTDINAELPKDYIDSECNKIYKGRFASPDEVADSIVYLCSDEATYITGSCITLDGGMD